MSWKTLAILLFMLIMVSGVNSALLADPIWFPSRVTNGSLEQWANDKPVGWRKTGLITTTQFDPFLGQYSVRVRNFQPWHDYLYQDITYSGGSFLFGCAHRSTGWLVGGEITIVYLDSMGQEISRRYWYCYPGDWQIILTILGPPEETATISIRLVPIEDDSGDVIVDHVFMIPLGGM
ncbi:MAG: hypothetical protein ACE5OP_07265 [Candidatus Glassbacteria bacterium]